VTAPLVGKAVVIIGGTAGLGLSAALACQRAGARVVALGRDDAALADAATALGTEAAVIPGDARDPAAAPAAIALCQERFGGFHGLYHVAGGSGRAFGDGPLHAVEDAAIEATLALNLHSLILSNRAAVRAFRAQGGGGAILNLGSVLAAHPAPRHFATAVYAAAKAGAEGFTRSIAAYYAGEGIRANLIAPGLVETPMSRRAAGDDALRAYTSARQPLSGPLGRPEDLDGLVVHLLSDAARAITGQIIRVDGGWSVGDGCPP
jgi:NAD(P)-dependent dehydrogenase (short-subunit alcohol dehydrogenase family)